MTEIKLFVPDQQTGELILSMWHTLIDYAIDQIDVFHEWCVKFANETEIELGEPHIILDKKVMRHNLHQAHHIVATRGHFDSKYPPPDPFEMLKEAIPQDLFENIKTTPQEFLNLLPPDLRAILNSIFDIPGESSIDTILPPRKPDH